MMETWYECDTLSGNYEQLWQNGRYFGISSIVERRFCDIGYSASGYSSVSIAIGASYFFAFSAVEYISRGILLHRAFT